MFSPFLQTFIQSPNFGCVLMSIKSWKPVRQRTHIENCVFGRPLVAQIGNYRLFHIFWKEQNMYLFVSPIGKSHDTFKDCVIWKLKKYRNLCFRHPCYEWWLVHYNYRVGTWVLEYDDYYYNYISIYSKRNNKSWCFSLLIPLQIKWLGYPS